MDLDVGLEFADAPLGRRQFRPLGGREARDEPALDLLLTPPGVDRLRADAEVVGEIGDPPPDGTSFSDQELAVWDVTDPVTGTTAQRAWAT